MEDNQVPAIQTTKSYGSFRFIRGNREILPGHLERLKEAISKRNLLPYNPILVNQDFQIIDGQHRFTICRDLGLPVYYLQVPGLNINDVMEINTHTRGWTTGDFVEAYIKLGYVEYTKLKQFVETHETTYPVAAQLLMQGVSYSRQENSILSIKSGKFKAMYSEFAETVFQMLHDIKPYAAFNPLVKRDLVGACARLIWLGSKVFDPDTLVKKLQFSGAKIEPRPTIQMYVLHLEDLYNYKNRDRIDLYSKVMSQIK